MGDIIDITGKLPVRSKRIEEAGERAGKQFRLFSPEAKQDIEEALASSKSAIDECEAYFQKLGVKLPPLPKQRSVLRVIK